jgi:ABC-type transport system involved in multi-copper enzyme maturation permease subunit
MSAVTATADMAMPAAFKRPGLGRLVQVELRKMLDTRAGFWMQATVIAATIVVVTILALVGHAEDRQFMDMLWVAMAPASILLPIVGILLVSSEWSQRTAVVTFTLVPQRMRVMAGKLGAAIVVAIVAFIACFVVALIATAIFSEDIGGVWSMPTGLLLQAVFSLTTALIMGVGFGALFLSSAPAIVLSFVLPLVGSALGSIHALNGVAKWVDVTRATSPLTDHMMSGTEWARAGTALALWMLLPLLIGLWRIARSELQ